MMYHFYFEKRWFNKDKPKSQSEFTSIINETISEYKYFEKNNNEILMTNLRNERSLKISRILNSDLKISNWIGKVVEIKNSGIIKSKNDNVVLTVELLNSNIKLGAWNNGFSDLDFNSQTPRDIELTNIIQGLKSGDIIKFSGFFFKDEEDYISEKSITEYGSMTEPEYVFRFTYLFKY